LTRAVCRFPSGIARVRRGRAVRRHLAHRRHLALDLRREVGVEPVLAHHLDRGGEEVDLWMW
jgi:hypothetical protein